MWKSTAPSNIALIKYMGKRPDSGNYPDNPSLSFTLDDLVTTVELSLTDTEDKWAPLLIDGCEPITLNTQAQTRFLGHLQRLKTHFGYQGHFLVRSNNNFPHSSGLASSASSFAALTKVACLALAELTQQSLPSIKEQAQWSRMGSGSSCRSFYTPWVLWEGEAVTPVDMPYKRLIHQVVIIEKHPKAVSSSEAHQRVASSPLYLGRPARTALRLSQLMSAMHQQDWLKTYQIVKDEFLDMHALFSTAAQPFQYMTDESKTVLHAIDALWQKNQDGPLVTMDAGPNIHLLYREDQAVLAEKIKTTSYLGPYHVR